MPTLSNKYRPKRFTEVVGQESEVEVLRTMLKKSWFPPAVLFAGAFGTGKTTLARLTARAILCENRDGEEPCGTCDSCVAMDRDNNPNYIEIDAASQGLVSDVRQMRDFTSYRSSASHKILCYDESHMLTPQAQNAMLQVLEEGTAGVMFMFATTDTGKMLPTIRSRCVELNMKLLTAAQVASRIQQVCDAEGVKYEEKALKVIGTYVRGHVRDAIVLLEQLIKMSGQVTEELVRTYLRLDRYVEVYDFLCLRQRAEGVQKLETLLCTYSPAELAELIGTTLVNAYKLSLGMDDFTQVDKAYLKKIAEAHPKGLLEKAERVLTLKLDYASIQRGITAIGSIFLEEEEDRRLLTAQAQPAAGMFRKPGK